MEEQKNENLPEEVQAENSTKEDNGEQEKASGRRMLLWGLAGIYLLYTGVSLCKVFINGVEDEEANSHVPETPTGNYGPYVVPEGSYFMLGDNREHSKDSRFWQNTFVTYDEIVGKAIVRYYPSIKVLE